MNIAALGSVNPFSECLNLTVVLGISKLATGIRSEGGLVWTVFSLCISPNSKKKLYSGDNISSFCGKNFTFF